MEKQRRSWRLICTPVQGVERWPESEGQWPNRCLCACRGSTARKLCGSQMRRNGREESARGNGVASEFGALGTVAKVARPSGPLPLLVVYGDRVFIPFTCCGIQVHNFKKRKVAELNNSGSRCKGCSPASSRLSKPLRAGLAWLHGGWPSL
jgi:hypothetical protein